MMTSHRIGGRTEEHSSADNMYRPVYDEYVCDVLSVCENVFVSGTWRDKFF
jgi:hypothetical protein